MKNPFTDTSVKIAPLPANYNTEDSPENKAIPRDNHSGWPQWSTIPHALPWNVNNKPYNGKSVKIAPMPPQGYPNNNDIHYNDSQFRDNDALPGRTQRVHWGPDQIRRISARQADESVTTNKSSASVTPDPSSPEPKRNKWGLSNFFGKKKGDTLSSSDGVTKRKLGVNRRKLAKTIGAVLGGLLLLVGLGYGFWELAKIGGKAFLESKLAKEIQKNTNLLDGIASEQEEKNLIEQQTDRLRALVGGLEEQNQIFKDGIDELIEVNNQLRKENDDLEEFTIWLEGIVEEEKRRLDRQEEELRQWNATLYESEKKHEELNLKLEQRWRQLQYYRRRVNAFRREWEFMALYAEKLRKQNDGWALAVAAANETVVRKWEEMELQDEINEQIAQNNNNLTAVIVKLNGTVDEWVEWIDIREEQLRQYQNLTLYLDQRVDELEETNVELTLHNANLSEAIDFLENLVTMYGEEYGDYLERRNATLQANLDSTYRSLQDYYTDKLLHYKSDLRDYFDGIWVWDDRRQINPDYYDVIDYVDRELLSHICVNIDDFRTFPFSYFPHRTPETILAREFYFVSQKYFYSIYQYLFPPDSNSYSGPRRSQNPQKEWQDFDYDCEYFEPAVNFTWIGNIALPD